MFAAAASAVWDDGRLAVRLWLRRPWFAGVVIATIALGIGAPTAMFSVIHAVLIQPLPYHEPDRIVQFRMESQGPQGPVAFDALPATIALEWVLASDKLTGISLFNDRALTLATPEGPFRLTGSSVTPNLFEVLAAPPYLGTTFAANTTDTRQVVLSHAAWERHFGGRPEAIGSSAMFDGESYLITGVMPKDFAFPSPDQAFWVPLLLNTGGTRGMVLPAVARLAPGVNVAAAQEEGQRLVNEGNPERRREMVLRVQTLYEQLVGGNRRLLWTLMAAVVVVSVIATTNIALLLLVRGAGRAREFSIRLAAGAPRRRIVRQLLVESATLTLVGGVAGVALAAALLRAFLQVAPPEIPRLQGVALNTPVLLFAAGLAVVTTAVFGVLSAGRVVTFDLLRVLATAPGESSLQATSAPWRRLNLLAITEVALTLVLLVGAGLLLRSFLALLLVDQGFNPSGGLVLQISMPSARYPTAAARLAFHDLLHQRLAGLPGVDAFGLTATMPNRQPAGRFEYNPHGLREGSPLEQNVAEVRMVSVGFLEAMGIPLRAGRTFLDSDGEGAEPVMVINERLARQHFGNENPIGRLLYSGTGTRRVVGVVGNVRPVARGADAAPGAFLPIHQASDIFQWFGTLNVVLRGSDPRALVPSVRALVLALDQEMPPFNVRTLDDEVGRLVAGPRFSASALAVFAAIALLLAAVGVYGVIAYSAGQRTREIGVRVALGATRRQVLWLVMRQGVGILVAGLFSGMIVAVWVAQTLAGLLHQVQPADPASLAAVSMLLSVIALVAIFLPAFRATRVNAVVALRAE